MQTPYLLVSMPQLKDGIFSKTVILMIEHSEKGAFGLIVNSPLVDEENSQAVLSAEIVDADGSTVNEFEETLILGGPVDEEKIFILHRNADFANADSQITDKLFLECDLDSFQKILGDRHLRTQCRFFVGCSAWTEGQLEDEIRSGSWLLVNYMESIVFASLPKDEEELKLWKEKLWKEAILSGGANPLTLMAQGSLVNSSSTLN